MATCKEAEESETFLAGRINRGAGPTSGNIPLDRNAAPSIFVFEVCSMHMTGSEHYYGTGLSLSIAPVPPAYLGTMTRFSRRPGRATVENHTHEQSCKLQASELLQHQA